MLNEEQRKQIVVDAKTSELALKASPLAYNVMMRLVQRLESKFGVKTYVGDRERKAEINHESY